MLTCQFTTKNPAADTKVFNLCPVVRVLLRFYYLFIIDSIYSMTIIYPWLKNVFVTGLSSF